MCNTSRPNVLYMHNVTETFSGAICYYVLHLLLTAVQILRLAVCNQQER